MKTQHKASNRLHPELIAPGYGGTRNNSDILNAITAYRTQAGSPMIDTGLWMTAFGVNPGIGAIEF